MTGYIPFASWSAASPYAVALVAVAVICFMCAVGGWRHRATPGGLQAGVTLTAAGTWALFYAFEVASAALAGKMVWAKMQYLGIGALPLAWFLFARSYTGATGKLDRRWLALLSLIPAATVVLAATNEYHGLIWIHWPLSTSISFPGLALVHGYWFWVWWTYAYALLAVGSFLLIRGVWRYPGLYRKQVGLVMLAVAAPWIGNALYIARVLPIPTLDVTPLAFAFTGLALTLNMSRFRLFSLQPALLPIARDQLLAEMSDAVLVIDVHGRIVTANPAARDLLGFQACDLAGKSALELRGDAMAALARGRDGQGEQRFEITLGEGTNQRGYDVLVSPVSRRSRRKSADIGHLLVFRDITERKRTDAALRKSQALLASTGRIAKVGGWEFDLRTRDLNLTEEVYRILDVPETFQPTAATVAEFFSPETMQWVREAMTQAIEEGRSFDLELPLAAVAGKPRWVRIIGEPEMDEGRVVAVGGAFQNISERKRVEEELRQSEEQLRQSQKMESVGRLAGGVAHDYNNVLGVILGHAQLALDQLDPFQPVYVDVLEIREAAKRSAAITHQLLGFARKQVVAPKQLDFNKSVEAMLNMLRRLVGEHIELRWMPGADLGSVTMDPSQLDQILMNLCVNARDAITRTGEVAIGSAAVRLDESFCAEHKGSVPGDYVRLSVRDNGHGMPKETLDHLFEPFFTTKDVGKGTGLGMATVYGIVKQNGGYIDVTSEPGQGANVDVYLPRSSAAAVEEGSANTVAANTGNSEVLLVVEDEASLLRMSKRVLTGLGYQVLSAQTPLEALRQAEAHGGEIALVVTDVILPEMGGRELVDRLLAFQPGLKTLYMSGYVAEAPARQGRVGYGAGFLQKPFTPQELATSVRATLSGREAECEP